VQRYVETKRLLLYISRSTEKISLLLLPELSIQPSYGFLNFDADTYIPSPGVLRTAVGMGILRPLLVLQFVTSNILGIGVGPISNAIESRHAKTFALAKGRPTELYECAFEKSRAGLQVK
jgi:hypothetical protein